MSLSISPTLTLRVLLVFVLGPSSTFAAEANERLLEKYCLRCHNPEKHEADIDLTHLSPRARSLRERKLWQRVLIQLESEEMPPDNPLPTDAERQQLSAWAEKALEIDWSKVRDPGRVTLPRLTRDEYNNTMRDLLGIDLQPGSEFSPDGEGGNGFNTDRDALFLTPALLEKYLAAAESALSGVIALEHEPMSRRYESEAMFMTETKSVPEDFGDGFKGYVLNRGQMTLYESVPFPSDGFYRFTVRLRSVGGPSGTRLRIDGDTKGDLFTASAMGETVELVTRVKGGTHQMTWNIELPSADLARKLRTKAEAELGAVAKQAPQFRQLPENAADLVNRHSPQNAPKYPATGTESKKLQLLIKDLDRAASSVQRPFEWLHLLGTEGNPWEIVRFKRMIAERSVAVDVAKAALALELGQSVEELNTVYETQNRGKLLRNTRLLEAVAAVDDEYVGKMSQLVSSSRSMSTKQKGPGTIAVDWIDIQGPIHPEGSEAKTQVFVARPSDNRSARAAAQAILQDFLPRAFRRPVSESDAARYLALFDRGQEQGDAFEPSVKLMLTAVLCSPHFLYRNELGAAKGEYRLDDYQLASRLSYFLWMTMPDDALMQAAASGGLHEPQTLNAQVDRMLADPRARAFVASFLGQWLGFSSLGSSVVPDAKKFPQFTPELCEAMKQETVLAFESLMRDGGSVLELVDSRHTWLNETLARHYEIEGVEGDEMRRVALNDPNRGGLLGMASVLTATSSPTRTNPVIRGKWVLETLLGETIPEPPADAGTLDPEAGEARGKSLREELLVHRRNPSCATCHNKLDPIGFGLENFDAIGRFRTEEAGNAVDSEGRLPGGAMFHGAAELKDVLLAERRDAFVRNLVERLLSFALGRQLKLYDESAIKTICEALERDEFSARSLIQQVVLSYPFQYQNNKPRAR